MLDLNLESDIFIFWTQILQPELVLIDEPKFQYNTLIL